MPANPRFCEYFETSVSPEALVGADCSQAAEQSKGLFSDPQPFVWRVEEVLERREAAIADHLEMTDGRILWTCRDVTQQARAKDVVDRLHLLDVDAATMTDESLREHTEWCAREMERVSAEPELANSRYAERGGKAAFE